MCTSKTASLFPVFSGMPQKNYEALGLTGATSKEGVCEWVLKLKLVLRENRKHRMTHVERPSPADMACAPICGGSKQNKHDPRMWGSLREICVEHLGLFMFAVEELHKKRDIHWGQLKQEEVERALVV